jgi:hypothetical protein
MSYRLAFACPTFTPMRAIWFPTRVATHVAFHKNRIASPIFVPPQARVRLHSDQRIAALLLDKKVCGAEDYWNWNAEDLPCDDQ